MNRAFDITPHRWRLLYYCTQRIRLSLVWRKRCPIYLFCIVTWKKAFSITTRLIFWVSYKPLSKQFTFNGSFANTASFAPLSVVVIRKFNRTEWRFNDSFRVAGRYPFITQARAVLAGFMPLFTQIVVSAFFCNFLTHSPFFRQNHPHELIGSVHTFRLRKPSLRIMPFLDQTISVYHNVS